MSMVWEEGMKMTHILWLGWREEKMASESSSGQLGLWAVGVYKLNIYL